MKRENYDKIKSAFEAYELARDMRHRYPDNLDFKDAVNETYDNLMAQIRFILWDEALAELKAPTNPDELPF